MGVEEFVEVNDTIPRCRLTGLIMLETVKTNDCEGNLFYACYLRGAILLPEEYATEILLNHNCTRTDCPFYSGNDVFIRAIK